MAIACPSGRTVFPGPTDLQVGSGQLPGDRLPQCRHPDHSPHPDHPAPSQETLLLAACWVPVGAAHWMDQVEFQPRSPTGHGLVSLMERKALCPSRKSETAEPRICARHTRGRSGSPAALGGPSCTQTV